MMKLKSSDEYEELEYIESDLDEEGEEEEYDLRRRFRIR
jgi:hypothetical protein